MEDDAYFEAYPDVHDDVEDDEGSKGKLVSERLVAAVCVGDAAKHPDEAHNGQGKADQQVTHNLRSIV